MRATVSFALMVVLAFTMSRVGLAQMPSQTPDRSSDLRPVQRQFGGWNAAPERPDRIRAGASPDTVQPASGLEGSPAQRAFYQQQQSLSDNLPSFPGGGYDSPSSTGAVLPALPALPGAQQQQVLPSSPPPQVNPAGYPLANPLANPQFNQQPGPTASQIYPSQNEPAAVAQSVPRQRTVPAQSVGNVTQQQDLRAIQNANTPTNTVNQQQPAVGLRNQQNYVTGPPFVSPPPGMGRYPTSPYQGPRYQTTAYQRNAPLAAQTVAAQTGGLVAPPGTVDPADLRPTLPQNQNLTGVYPTAFQQQCAPSVNYPGTGAVPGTYVPPTLTQNLTPNLYSANNSGYSPLFSLGQENYNVLLGRGLIGQPTVYVPGQPFRNFFRYISP